MKQRPLTHQKGLVLLVMLVVFIAMGGTVFSTLLAKKAENVNRTKVEHDLKVLRQAKQGLLSYALNYHKDGNAEMGRLPCPHIGGTSASEGTQNSICGNQHTNSVGFFPWKTLGVDELRDSSGACLWYVVSGDYKTAPKAKMLNEDSVGRLQVQDENGNLYHDPNDLPIALIIAPGVAGNGQTRASTCEDGSDESNYLESDGSVVYSTDHANTADQIWTYIYGGIESQFNKEDYNDKIIWITQQEYWDAVKAQGDLDLADPNSAIHALTKNLAECLADYANEAIRLSGMTDTQANGYWQLPTPAPQAATAEDYRDSSTNIYKNDINATATNGGVILEGRLPMDITSSKGAASITVPGYDKLFNFCVSGSDPGSATPSQPKIKSDINKDFLENWKDHFFYTVSRDFTNLYDKNTMGSRCDVSSSATKAGCLEIHKVNFNNFQLTAAVLLYSGSATTTQSRTINQLNAALDERWDKTNYQEGDNANGTYTTNSPSLSTNPNSNDRKFSPDPDEDLVYCIIWDDTSLATSTKLEAKLCSAL